VQKQMEGLIEQAKYGIQVSMIMHVTIFIIGVIVLLGSAYLVFGQGFEAVQRWVGAAGGTGALATLLLLFYRNPLQNIRASVSSLMEVDVIFRGYIRQLNQIDATFKHMFLGGNSFGTSQMKETVEQIQSTVKSTLDLVKNNNEPPPPLVKEPPAANAGVGEPANRSVGPTLKNGQESAKK